MIGPPHSFLVLSFVLFNTSPPQLIQAFDPSAFSGSPTVLDDNFSNNYEAVPINIYGDNRGFVAVNEHGGNDVKLYTSGDLSNRNSLWSDQTVASSYSRGRSIAVADLDGDGYPDLIVGEQNDDVGILFNEYDPGGVAIGFSSNVDILVGNCGDMVRITPADLNGDGCTDFVATCKSDDVVKWWKNPCGASAQTGSSWSYQELWQSSSSYDKPIALAVADFNNDDKPDIVFGMDDEDANGVVVGLVSYASTGGDITVSTTVLTLDNAGADSKKKVQAVTTCDADGDGKIDIISVNKAIDEIHFFKNRNGLGGDLFATSIEMGASGSEMSDIRCEDIDGDGDFDLIVADKTHGIFIVENMGSVQADGTFFSSSKHIIFTSQDIERVHLGDLDDDGMLDIVYATKSSPDDSWISWNEATCPAGKYMVRSSKPMAAGQCTPCAAGKYSANENILTSCTSCQAGKYSNAVGASSDLTCADCSNLGPTFYSSSPGSTSCSECSALQLPNAARTSCSFCIDGYVDFPSCTACIRGKYAQSGDDSCTSCPAGRASTTEGAATISSCAACGQGKYALEASSSCTDCTPGKYSDTESGTSESVCISCSQVGETSYAPSPGASSCLICSPLLLPNAARTACEFCIAGYAPSTPGGVDCQICSAGRYGVLGSDTCESCPAGKAGPNAGAADADSCTACSPGKWAGGDSPTCSDCDAGKFSDAVSATSEETCVSCGTISETSYSPTPGSTSCLTCSGLFIPNAAKTECSWCLAGYKKVLDSCVECTAGYYATAGSSFCSKCPAGRFSGLNGQTSVAACNDCEAGSFSGRGAASCVTCGPGKYEENTRASSCGGSCAAGRYNPYRGQTSEDSCLLCDAGKAAADVGSSFCVECDAGKFSSIPGSTICFPCDEGKSSGVGSRECSGMFFKNVVPNVGDTRGGDVITIVGKELGESNVIIGGQPCPVISDESNSTLIKCVTPAGYGKDWGMSIRKNDGTGTVSIKGVFSYKGPIVSGVLGCSDYAELDDEGDTVQNSGTLDCPTVGGETITIDGNYFGAPDDRSQDSVPGERQIGAAHDLIVWVGDSRCTNVTLSVPHTQIVCTLPPGTGEYVGVSVNVNEQVGTELLLSYAPPVIESVRGCADDLLDFATKDCPRSGNVDITVTGNNFGPFQPVVMVGGLVCSPVGEVEYDSENQTTTICTLPPGSGTFKGVNAIQINGLVSYGVKLVSYDLCNPGEYNVLNETLGYFVCAACPTGYVSNTYEAFSCSLCLSGGFVDGPTSCVSCNSKILGSKSLTDGATSVDSCVCPVFTYMSTTGRVSDDEVSEENDDNTESLGSCVGCTQKRGVNCNIPGQTLETLEIKPGFWRTGPTSTEIMRCYSAVACIGGNVMKNFTTNASNRTHGHDDSDAPHNHDSDAPHNHSTSPHDEWWHDDSYYRSIQSYEWSNNYCLEGYVGPYCQVCDIGYSGAFGGCRKCLLDEEKNKKITWTVVTFVSLILLGIGFARLISKFSQKTKKGLLIAGKLLLSTSQILIAVPSVFEVILPENFLKFLSLFDFLNFSFIDLFDIGCSIETVNIHWLMVTVTITPFLLTLPIIFMYLYHCCNERGGGSTKQAMESLKMNTYSLLLSLSYIVLPGTSASIFSVYPCDTLDDGKMWLKNDYSVSCADDNFTHKAFVGYAGIMMCIYPIGIPLMYTFLLLRTKGKLNPSGSDKNEIERHMVKGGRSYEEEVILKREADESLQHTVFLWGSYRPHAWWFEIFECCRRLALTGALVFVRQGSQTQIAVGLLICIGSALVFALAWPYATMRDNVLGILTQCQLVGTLFAAMMYKVSRNTDLAYDQTGTGWLLIVLNGGVFLIIFFWCGYEILGDEGPGLRSRERFWLKQASFMVKAGDLSARYNAKGARGENAGISMRNLNARGDLTSIRDNTHSFTSAKSSLSTSDSPPTSGKFRTLKVPSVKRGFLLGQSFRNLKEKDVVGGGGGSVEDGGGMHRPASRKPSLSTIPDDKGGDDRSSSFFENSNPLSRVEKKEEMKTFADRQVEESLRRSGLSLASRSVSSSGERGGDSDTTNPINGEGGGGLERGSLPPDWTKLWSDEHQQYYFHNSKTDTTTWERPSV